MTESSTTGGAARHWSSAYTVVELREARTARFSGPGAVERHTWARTTLALAAICTGVLGALPIIIAAA